MTVTLPTPLVVLFPGSSTRVELAATTVGAVVDELDRRWPGMRDRLCEPAPRIRRHLKVFVNGRQAQLETPLSPGAEVTILTAISGG